MPKKQKEDIKIEDILRYKNQILLMKRIIDEISEPTEEEKKYKEKHGKDMGYPKDFHEATTDAGIWEWREREFARLSAQLGILVNYYDGKSTTEQCKKAWDDFDRNTTVKNGHLVDIQERVHKMYAVGDGEFSALTNPRVRRLVQIADIAGDLEGLKNAIYERELVKDIQQNAYKVRVNKKTYLTSKREFADKYQGITVEQRRKLVSEYLTEVSKLNEKNQKLENQIREDEKSITESEEMQQICSKKLVVLEQRKLEYDTKHRVKAKEVAVIKAYRAFNKLSKDILEWEEQIKVIQGEETELDNLREKTRKERIELCEKLLEKKDPVALKYKDTYTGYFTAEQMMTDTELIEKHPELYKLVVHEYGMMNAASSTNVNRAVDIENLQLKISRAETEQERNREIINNNDLPDLQFATDAQLSNAQHELRKMDEESKLVIQNLEDEIEEMRTNIQNAKDFIDEKTNAITTAKAQIQYNKQEIDKYQNAYGEMKEVVDKAAMAMYHYNELQSSKRNFVDSMEGFNFGKKTASRLITKANTYNLDEGTRWRHKNTSEFNKMKDALDKVKKCDPADRGELKNRLKDLGIAAKEYREKKLKDGGFNTGMRNIRLTKAQNLITMCELGIQELSAIPEKKEKILTDFKQDMVNSLKKHQEQDNSKKLNDMQIVDAKLNRAHEKADKFDARLELADKKIDEIQELMEYDDDFSK